MFRNWGFLLGEIWVLILLAALLGLFAGWLIWGRRSSVDVDGLNAQLEGCRRDCGDRDTRIAALEADLETATRNDVNLAGLQARLDDCGEEQARKDARIAELEAQLAAAGPSAATGAATAAAAGVMASAAAGADDATQDVAEAGDQVADAATGAGDDDAAAQDQAVASADAGVDYDGDGILEGENEGTRPAALDGPRAGGADDLKQIKGIGPKLEQLCHRLGFYHFDQIAGWTAQEVAWVDANLEGFRGRVSRDDWVTQAKVLAAGGETEFASRVKDGDVY